MCVRDTLPEYMRAAALSFLPMVTKEIYDDDDGDNDDGDDDDDGDNDDDDCDAYYGQDLQLSISSGSMNDNKSPHDDAHAGQLTQREEFLL
ncbi:Hypothetical protein, putative [Bodo saltans]|uniref:Uncharacterized protein n=1 Tax=Bodo saltans TaxID=75058 RepID=A0A0S4IL44_BODSA|nr:Hypothetical protein, putative [Bodo saltans]|eukprot:CUE70491.1 Hypothetical protein, putative [Bodo saltans]